MARIASIWLIALAITVNSAASKGHYHDKNYFGRFEDLDRPGKTGKIILSFHSKAVSGVRYFKGRAVILRGSIVENLGLDTYGWLSGDKALLFTDKKFVWDNISPPNRFEVLNFYGFGSSGLATHYPAVFCNYRFELFFRGKIPEPSAKRLFVEEDRRRRDGQQLHSRQVPRELFQPQHQRLDTGLRGLLQTGQRVHRSDDTRQLCADLPSVPTNWLFEHNRAHFEAKLLHVHVLRRERLLHHNGARVRGRHIPF
ncbi:hypothetical protein MHBO_003170 [Bonamia ostreae]|uniref:Uncharacterized protein n=1 Tax=Bonamia ostreae TaxID=126728 RepID=A0ABV2APN6_9EUKA